MRASLAVRIVTVVFMTSRVHAATVYVSPSGGHSAPFASWETAATNIQAAVDAASPGDTVLVGDGDYDTGDRLSLGTGSTRRNRVVIDRAITVRSVNGPQHASIVGEPGVRCAQVVQGATLMGFTIRDGYAGGGSSHLPADSMGGGVYLAASTLENCIVRSNWVGYVMDTSYMQGGGVYVRDGGVVQRCDIRDNWGYFGANVFMEEGALRNSLIRDGHAWSSGGGIYLNAGAAKVQQCTVVGNLGFGVFGHGGTVDNCIVVSNVYLSGDASNWFGSGVSYRHTCTLPAPSGAGNTDLNPRFVSYGAGDFHLETNSPCIDAGASLTNIVDDLDGTPRPLDGNGDGSAAWDIGAYELDGGTPSTNTTLHYVSLSGGHVPPFASWETAATNIQAAVDAAAPGDTVLMSEGVYGVKTAVVVGKALSVVAAPMASNVVIDGGGMTRCMRIDAPGVLVEGLTLRNGRATNVWNGSQWEWGHGGGILAACPADIVACVFAGNSACQLGGGLCLSNGGTIARCRFVGNGADEYPGGGGAFVRGGRVSDSLFDGNSCVGRPYEVFTWYSGYIGHSGVYFPGWAYGGGLRCESNTVVERCVFRGNSAQGGSGVYDPGGGLGGGLFADGSTVRACISEDNTAGGGYQSAGQPYGESKGGGICAVNSEVQNCVIRRNRCFCYPFDQGKGGGLFSSGSRIQHCTVVSNGPRGIFATDSEIYNTIASCNRLGESMMLDVDDVSNNVLAGLCAGAPLAGNGNITNEPAFQDGSAGDYHLASNSPCIDAGISLTNVVDDFDGTPRPLDGNGDGVAAWDIGAYEFLLAGADSDHDGLIDGEEIGALHTNPARPDSDGDGMPDGDEVRAGCSPTNAHSVFFVDCDVSGPMPEGSSLAVRWPSVAGRQYDLMRSTNLLSGFVPLAAGIPATAPMNTYTDAAVPQGEACFYRVKLAEP